MSPDLWRPPNSPDLNPVDYRIWGLMHVRVYKTAVPDVSQLRQRLIDTWSSLSQDVIDDAVDQWRVRLRVCEGKGTSFRVPAVANRLFSEPPPISNRLFS